jgi:hypothetical protein
MSSMGGTLADGAAWTSSRVIRPMCAMISAMRRAVSTAASIFPRKDAVAKALGVDRQQLPRQHEQGLLWHVVGGDGNEGGTAGVQHVRGDRLGAREAGEMAARLAEDLGDIGGPTQGGRDGEQHLGFARARLRRSPGKIMTRQLTFCAQAPAGRSTGRGR